MTSSNRLPPDAAHEFGGIGIDRSRPLTFRLNGRRIDGFAGDTVLTAVLASGIDTYGEIGKIPLALTDRFAPLVAGKDGLQLPVERLPARDSLDLSTIGPRRLQRRQPRSLGHRIDGIAEPPWLRAEPEISFAADLLIVGGGVAGLAAANAAASAGRSVILVERRPWLGGDARYFGAVGEEESPEAASTALIEALRAQPGVTLLTHAEAFALQGSTVHVHQIEDNRGRVLAVAAGRILLATGSAERLPVFAGNRTPGVVPSMAAYHLAKRYGVGHGRSAVVATQSNFGYRLAMRLADAGVEVRRVVDVRINPQSRFVDFAKASGITLSGGQRPLAAIRAQDGLALSFANAGSDVPALALDADRLIVTGTFQPEVSLWMLAGGSTHWQSGALRPRGDLGHIALAGSVAGYRTMRACLESGRQAASALFGGIWADIEDREIGPEFETPESPTTIGPEIPAPPAFFDSGSSLIARPAAGARPVLTGQAYAPSVGDVAASVDLGLTSPADAGAVAEERGAPGGDLGKTDWTPAPRAADDVPAWLGGRFGSAPQRRHLIVDARRKFARGALVYSNTARPDPDLAIGVIVAAAPDGQPGGIALLSGEALATTDRFIVETLDGPSPARLAPG